jgi:membrane protease YdiL (CAAX protease family)
MKNNTATSDSVKPWVRTLLILPAFLIIGGLFQWAGYLVLGLDPSNYHLEKSLPQETVVTLFTLGGTIVTVGIFRRFIDQETFQSMGFYPNGYRNESIIGIWLGALLIAIGFATLVSLQEIQWTGTNVDFSNILWGIVLFILVALNEELLLRGYVLNNLMKSMNHWIALPVSAVMFSLGHIFNDSFSLIGFCNILLAGILLGLPYIYTKSLWFPIALHFSWNFFQGIIFGFNVSGHVTYSLFTQSRTADNIWNGGKFGFEGSVLSLVFQVIAIFFLWRYYKKKAESLTETVIYATIPEIANEPEKQD